MLLQPAHVLPEFIIHVLFRTLAASSSPNISQENQETWLSCNPKQELLRMQGDGAEMALLANECANLTINSTRNQTSTSPSYDAQEAIRIKQAALLKIETAIDDFRVQRQQRLLESVKRMRSITAVKPS
jgi:hypothetical protein